MTVIPTSGLVSRAAGICDKSKGERLSDEASEKRCSYAGWLASLPLFAMLK